MDDPLSALRQVLAGYSCRVRDQPGMLPRRATPPPPPTLPCRQEDNEEELRATLREVHFESEVRARHAHYLQQRKKRLEQLG